MSSTTTEVDAGRPDARTLRLVHPEGLFDLMAPERDEDALARFRELFSEMFPRATADDVDVLADGLLQWRGRLLAGGVLMHGLVLVPAGRKVAGERLETPAHWHLMAGLVDVPAAGELNAGEILAGYFDGQFSPEHTYTEAFDTAMGWGFGMITTVPLTPLSETVPEAAASLDDGSAPLPARLGLVAALSAPRDRELGLLVVGLCLDSERVATMGNLVAVIAGQSEIVFDEDATEEPTGAERAR